MRHVRIVWFVTPLIAGLACGGSTDSGGSGGTGATAGSAATGGMGNVGGSTGGKGGADACATTTCGPPGGACCDPTQSCTIGMSYCNCTAGLTWSCITEGGGSGGTGGCVDLGCGPTGSSCCQPGSACGAGGGAAGSCTCTNAYTWDCGSATGGAAGAGGVMGCSGAGGCGAGLTCCAGSCVNTANDPFNCGACGNACAASPPYCSGLCAPVPCSLGKTPPPGYFCCGQAVCANGDLCCDVQGPGPSGGPVCFTPTAAQPTCPVGCPLCQ